jgi:MerR family transcriptional regulator, light-induced transcriptional regulator
VIPLSVQRLHPSAHLRIGQLSAATGVDPATLRSWEARYGVPASARTAGRQRRYPVAEVDRVAAMVRLIDAGYRASEAARAVAEAALPLRVPAPGAGPDSTDVLDALIRGDLEALQLLDAVAAGRRIEDVITDVVSPVMHRVGELWAAGAIDVAQEHAASALVAAWLGAQTKGIPPPLQPGLIVTAAPAGERHELGLIMFGIYLRRQGIRVLHLGADLPVVDLAAAVAARTPEVVCLGVSTDAARAGYVATITRLSTLEQAPRLCIGGPWKPPPVPRADVVTLPDDYAAATAQVIGVLASELQSRG